MSSKETWVEYEQFVRILTQMSHKKQTGTVFCTTDDGNSVTLGLKQGKIVSLTYRTLRGIDALEQIEKINSCRLNFRLNVLIQTDNDLPSTEIILKSLDSRRPLKFRNAEKKTATPSSPQDQNQEAAQSADQEHPAPVAQARAAAIEAEALPENLLQVNMFELRAVVEDVGTDMFGPVAMLLCAEEFDSNPPHDLEDLRVLLRNIVQTTGELSLLGPFIGRIIERTGLEQRTRPRH